MKPAVLAKSISYAYGSRPVLQDLSFSVDTGSNTIVLGPNGSGKTTLLRMIAGLLKPRNGDMHLMDRPIKAYSRGSLARTVALVPQISVVDFPFTVLEMVLMGRAPHLGMLALERKADMDIARRSMAFTGIEHLAHRKITQLSGGEQQRAFIARAICQEPKLILLDEPTASLDLAHQIRIMDLMDRLRDDLSATIIMVSHDINLAAMYADRILLLKSGKIAAAGLPSKILTYQTIEAIYDCTVLVDESPMGRFPRITPVPGRYKDPNR